jgi:hypothetical protein
MSRPEALSLAVTSREVVCGFLVDVRGVVT